METFGYTLVHIRGTSVYEIRLAFRV